MSSREKIARLHAMADGQNTSQKAQLSDYLAAERTLLAWIRTGLALMGFGFVVARFGLFLQQLELFQHAASIRRYGLSLWFGTALIVAGVAVFVLSAWRHYRLVAELDRGEPFTSRRAMQAVAIAVFLALIGLAMAIYLIIVRGDTNPLRTQNGEAIMATPSLPAPANRGIIEVQSSHSVHETVERLKNILQAKGVTLFALVDHSGEAEKVGLKMPPTKLLIFGTPKAGTPLMLAAPSAAIDLPLKILVAQNAEGKTIISYNSPDFLRDRHGFPQELLQNIAVAGALAQKAAE